MRPAFHFTPAAGWINDPHGLRHWNGEYHAFFQYIPERTEWSADIHWGHAKGPDLLSLEELPVAIFPGDGDGGIWTGSLVVDDEGAGAHLLHVGHRTDLARIRVATPDGPDWLTWQKGAFVADAPAEMGAFRDPWVFRDGDSEVTAGAWSSAAATGTAGRRSSRTAPPTSTTGPIRASRCALRPTRGRRCRRTPSGSARSSSRSTAGTCSCSRSKTRATPRTSATPWAAGRTAASRPRSWGRLSFSRSHYAPTFVRDERAARRSSSGSARSATTPPAGPAR